MSVKSYLLSFDKDLLSIIDYSNECVEPVLVHGEKAVNSNEYFWNDQKKFWKWLADKESLRAKDTLKLAFVSNKKADLEKIVYSPEWQMDWDIDSLINVLTECYEQSIDLHFGKEGRCKKITIENADTQKSVKLYVFGYSQNALDLALKQLEEYPKEVVRESCSEQEVDEKNGIGYEFFEKRMKNNEDNRIKNKKSAKKIKMSAR